MNQAHHPQKASIKSILSLCLISTALGQALPAQAQIIPDNTLSSEASQLKQNLIINGTLGDKIEGGATRGSNLFHSFSEFNIENGQRVYFANPTGIENILTRVTGGNASNIFGTLGVNGAANLFLINPNGILFGQNARLDVQGSFVGTTANGVQFGNQGIFSATNPQAPPLLTVNPSALFFNQLNQGAAIQNNSIARAGTDPAGFNVYGLRVPDGKSLLLVGGNVSMDGGELNAYGGRVELGGLAAPGNVNLLFNGDNLSLKFPENVTRADVSLTNQARVYVEAAGGGDIAINARNIDIVGGSLLNAGIAEGLGKPEATAGDITLNATGDIKVADSGSRIRNLVREDSKGNGGNIFIDSGSFSLQDGAQLAASTSGVGNAGNVTVGAKNAVSLANGDILSTVEAGGVGKGGNIDINAATLLLTDGAQLLTATRAASATQPAGQGNAGNVNVLVTGAVDIAGEKNGFKSAIFTSVGTGARGNGGNVNISSGSFFLTDGARLIASTSGQGLDSPKSQAGNITLNTTGKIEVAGTDSAIRSNLLTGGIGNGGNITIDSGSFSLSDGAQLEASTYGRGNAGNVTVSTKDAVSLASNAYILSAVEAGGVGKGGNIDINAATLSLTDGAQLLTATRGASATQPAGQGNAGNVNVLVTGAVDIAGEKNDFKSAIFTSVGTGARGNGGNVNISSGSFFLTDGARLVASTSGQGLDSPKSQAGNIILNTTGKVEVAGENSAIRSTLLTGGVGNGGNITIDSGSFSLQDGAKLSASTYGQGNAGNVTVGAKDAVDLVGNAYIFSTVEAGGVGKGGNIDINAATLSLTDGAQLLTATRAASATQPSARGDAGNVNVLVTGTVDIAGEKNNFPSGIRSNVGTGTVGNGGNIFIDSGSFSLSDGAVLTASTSGVGNAGNVTVAVKDTVSLAGGDIFSNVETGGVGNSGGINIRGSSLSLTDGALLEASTYGEGNAGNVTVSTKDAVSLASNAYILSAVEAGGVGKGGNIDINAATLSLTDGAQLLTITRGASATQPAGRGDAGNVNVLVTGAVDIAGEKNDFPSGIRSNVGTGTVGNGGNIFIDSGSFSLSDGAELYASTSGVGNAGNVTVGAKNAVSLASNAYIFSNVETGGVGNSGGINIRGSSLSLTDGAQLQSGIRGADTDKVAGRGNGGSVDINVTGAVTISGTKDELASAIFTDVETGARGNGGNINISSGSFFLTDGARLVASTSGQGLDSPKSQAGNITLNTTGKTEVAGENSAIRSTLLIGGVGNGGNITIDSGSFSLSDGAKLSASTSGVGNAGNVTVGALDAVSLSNGDILSAVEAGGVGKGGNIDINAATLSLTDSAQLLTITRAASATQPAGRGDAGNVNVLVTGAVDIAGEKNGFPSGIRSNVGTGTVGNGGNIFIDSGSFSLSDGAELSASTSGVGNAGNVTVGAKNAVFLASNAYIFSTVQAGGVGQGGNIDINATTLSLTDGAQLLTATREASATQPAGQGNAGNVNVLVTGAVDIAGEKNGFKSAIFTDVETGARGNGGNINISSGSFFLTDGARLVASTSGQGLDSPKSQAGNITLNTTGKTEVAGENSAIRSTLLIGGVGNGGNITIDSGSFSLSDGAKLEASTSGVGNAGNVTVGALDAVDLASNAYIFSTVEAGGVGKGGNIDINAATLSLTDGAQLLASTSGVGNAGNVTVGAKNAVSLVNGDILSTVEAGGVGKGGN
ncbi:beta strand repeat-containing protein, partial [Nostoc sp.]|uniref:beta strand repeat-containing protein n=1 Tax=Nostoc sp. TaxID=1180 RepID=UPI002FF9002E